MGRFRDAFTNFSPYSARRDGIHRRILFLHIPRSAGSNLWHSCAKALAVGDNSIPILDLYHESVARYRTVFQSQKVARELDLSSLDRCLVHHHTSFGIWRVLGNRFTYFTILRDPVERAISHYFHSLNLYYDVDQEKNECHLKCEVSAPNSPQLGDDALKTFLRISRTCDLMSPDAITEFIATHHGMAGNYYANFLSRYFSLEEEADHAVFNPKVINRQTAADIALKMRQHFAGIFFSIEDAFDFIEQNLKKKIEHRNILPNRGRRARISDPLRLRSMLLPYFSHDYALFEFLRVMNPKS